MKKKRVFKALILCLCMTAMTLCVTACAEKDNPTSETLVLSLNKENLGLDVFEQYDLDVENGEQIVWSSEDESIATVNADGIVTGVSQGTTNIIATVGNQILKCEVTVRASEDVPTIVLDEETVELLIGDDYTISPKVLYKQNKYEASYTYTSHNEQIAKVDENGKITAVEFGTTKIEISANWGIYADSIYLKKIVDVIVKEDVTLRIESEAFSISLGETRQLTAIAKVKGIEMTDGLVWSSSDSEIISVNQDGIVTAGAGTKFGTAEIFVSYTSTKSTYKSLPVLVTLNKPVRDLTNEVVFDYDLSKQVPLSFNDISGLEGTILKIALDEKDITSKLNDGEIAYDTASKYPLGERALTIETDRAVYKLNMTIASYVISDTESMDAWYTEVKTIAKGGKKLYVVVAADFTYSGDGFSVWPGNVNNGGCLTGVFDGRGHVITGVKISTYTMFIWLDGTMKNIAFKDLTSTGTNALHGLLARYTDCGRLENVYISGTAGGTVKDIIAGGTGGVNNKPIIKNCIFNVTLAGTDAVFFNSGTTEATNGTFTNVYAISSTKTSINKGGDSTGIFSTANAEFFAAVSANMTDSLFSVEENALYFNGQLMVRGQKTLAASDYDLSKGESLTVEGISGTATKVTLDSADITADVTAGENSISVVYDKAKDYGLGVHTLTIETANTVYALELTIASYVISDTESMDAWYTEVKTIAKGGKKLYVVVAADFTYSGDGFSVWPGNVNNGGCLTGVFDGRGHVITGVKISTYTMFIWLDGTMKNIAFKDLTSTGTNALHGLLARYTDCGRLENVYISGTAGGTVKDIIAGGTGGVNNKPIIKNCIFNVTLAGTDAVFFNSGTTEATNGTFTNVYAISSTKTSINKGGDSTGIFSTANAEFFAAVSANMTDSLFSVKDSSLYFGTTKLF